MTHLDRVPLVLVLAAAIGLGVAGQAVAFNTGSKSVGANTPSCHKGYVYNAKKHACVQSTSSLLGDSDLYTQGRDLALAGRYQEALDALNAVAQKDSMTLTMIGYATRKSGDYERGVDYYRQALALDPSNVNTREYLGEAYAEKGRIDDAKAELAKVVFLCGKDCEQYRDLAAAIAGTPDPS